jgi:hypothetical protein
LQYLLRFKVCSPRAQDTTGVKQFSEMLTWELFPKNAVNNNNNKIE